MTDEEGSKDWKGEKGFFTKRCCKSILATSHCRFIILPGPGP